jgi:hypothetical protein
MKVDKNGYGDCYHIDDRGTIEVNNGDYFVLSYYMDKHNIIYELIKIDSNRQNKYESVMVDFVNPENKKCSDKIRKYLIEEGVLK